VETFTELKEFAENPHYPSQKRRILSDLTEDMIDMPIVDLVNGYNQLPHCFTLQSCYGHFVYKGQNDLHNFEPLPAEGITGNIEYRIAYIAFCLENNSAGRRLLDAFKEVTSIDPDNIQFCCAEWFWKRQLNSYALQVEPDRFKRQDTAIVDFKEALHMEKIRNTFFMRLHELLEYEKEISN
jgi:hypothetical protein